jgi:hypothetical protein
MVGDYLPFLLLVLVVGFSYELRWVSIHPFSHFISLKVGGLLGFEDGDEF